MKWIWSGDQTDSERRIQGVGRIIHVKIMGSKAEWLSCYLVSDMDQIIVLNIIIYLDDGVNAYIFPMEIIVLRSCSRKSYPGHCRLLLERTGTKNNPYVNDAFCDYGYGHELLIRDLFVNSWLNLSQANEVQHDRARPAIHKTVRGALQTDMVHAYSYFCPTIQLKWAARPCHLPQTEAV
ncbi:hypothetical protein DPMN_038834 [Dreissena polymorpha]|uniref:Uncharacterized protein n=1 Tax=Dreissena polymorpha TaxID=45954 RepID=A0A9D4RNL4_DREPO|nr:hypothetical protein DPMN_038834 [Dreissena polymorpha]